MAIKVRIPTPLQKITANQAEVLAKGSSLRDVLDDLGRQYPGLLERLYDEKGALRRFINFYVNNEDIRFLKGETTPIKEGDEISIVPAIAGGTDEGARHRVGLSPRDDATARGYGGDFRVAIPHSKAPAIAGGK